MSRRVFFVDDQEDIVWSTTKMLARKCPDLTLEGFTEPLAALEALKQSPPDILVTDLRMEEMSGLELMVASRRVVKDLPVIMVTAYGGPEVTAALHGRSLVEYLEKPVRTEELIAAIDRLLARGEGFSGAISLPMLPDLIQIYTLSQTSGALAIRQEERSGTLWFDTGKIVHAVCGEKTGEEAVYELLAWQGGEFSLDTTVQPTEQTITATWQEVLLEGCRRMDEEDRDSPFGDEGEWLPDDDDTPAATQVQVPPDLEGDEGSRALNGVSPSIASTDGDSSSTVDLPNAGPASASENTRPEGDRLENPTFDQPKENRNMATEKQATEAFDKIRADVPGFIAASLVDTESGMTLAVMSNRPDFDLAAASAFNSEVVKQKLKTIKALNLNSNLEDILLTLSDQLHIIKMVGDSSFIYLAADRAQSNLAIMRSSMSKHTASLN